MRAILLPSAEVELLTAHRKELAAALLDAEAARERAAEAGGARALESYGQRLGVQLGAAKVVVAVFALEPSPAFLG